LTLPAHVADWPADVRFEYEERAAIIEYDGGRPRDVAEREAEQMIRVLWSTVQVIERRSSERSDA
jgi:hypothetical protein